MIALLTGKQRTPSVLAHRESGVTVVTLLEPRLMDAIAIRETFEQISRIVENSYAVKLVLNLENVRNLSSGSLVYFARLGEQLKRHGGSLKLCCVHPLLSRLFRISRLDRTIPIYDGPSRAVKAFQRRLLRA